MPGRTQDLKILQPPAVPGGPSTQALGDAAGGWAVAGVDKLAQRFVLRLLTRAGSQAGRPEEGCGFLDAVTRARNPYDVAVAFRFAVAAIQSLFAREAAASDPADEVFASADVSDVTLSPGGISLRVTVVSKAGTSRTRVVPVRR